MNTQSKPPKLTRRSALAHLAGGSAAGAFLGTWPIQAGNSDPHAKPVRFGVITDVHKDIMHDADHRLEVFIRKMTAEQVDFVIQLGDFCVPKESNQGFLDIWNTFPGARYHVLGNHDTDGGYRREDTVDWWRMTSRYYSFDLRGVHFVVLDGNDRPADHQSGYPRYVAEDQLQWLRADLAKSQSPTFVFIHQSVERPDQGGVQNGAAVREILDQANASAETRKVVACFSGHHHRDYLRRINGILYPQINSASYHWVGTDFQHPSYPPSVHQRFPYIQYTVPYRDPLFGLVTINPGEGVVAIEGRQSSFVGPAPWEVGKDRTHWDAETLTASISDWRMAL